MLRTCWVVAAGLLWVGPAAAGTWADALFTEKSKDFGSVPRGPELSHSFKVKNTTQGAVTIGGARVSCNVCSSVSVGKSTLAAGEETTVTVKMYTGRFHGVKTIHIYVTFTSPQFDEVLLWTQANSRDDVNLTPDTLAFGTVRAGATPAQSATVTFFGIGGQIVGVDTETNYVKAEAKQVAGRSSAETSYQITATLRDDTPVGRWYTDVWVRTNNPAMPRLRLPLTVEVTAPLTVSAKIVSFGEVKQGQSAEKRVSVRGPRPFAVKEIKGAGDGVEVKDITEGKSDAHTLVVSLKSAKAGDVGKTIAVVTDLADDGKVEFSVKGKVVP